MRFVVDKVALGHVFLRVLLFSPVSIIPPLLHIHISPPHEVCYSSEQAAHYHHLGPKLGASLLTRHFGWKQNRKVKDGRSQRLEKIAGREAPQNVLLAAILKSSNKWG
jgi:hypothetical protein